MRTLKSVWPFGARAECAPCGWIGEIMEPTDCQGSSIGKSVMVTCPWCQGIIHVANPANITPPDAVEHETPTVQTEQGSGEGTEQSSTDMSDKQRGEADIPPANRGAKKKATTAGAEKETPTNGSTA